MGNIVYATITSLTPPNLIFTFLLRTSMAGFLCYILTQRLTGQGYLVFGLDTLLGRRFSSFDF